MKTVDHNFPAAQSVFHKCGIGDDNLAQVFLPKPQI